MNAESLAPAAALARGWCLMKLNRPMEAADAFEIGLRSPSPAAQRDAAYGQSLAYLQAGLVDKAAVSAVKAPQTAGRVTELKVDLLSSRATSAFEAKRYRETLLALDERARLVPEPTDLMILRGYAYLALKRLDDAETIFSAVAATGNTEAFKVMMIVKEQRR